MKPSHEGASHPVAGCRGVRTLARLWEKPPIPPRASHQHLIPLRLEAIREQGPSVWIGTLNPILAGLSAQNLIVHRGFFEHAG